MNVVVIEDEELTSRLLVSMIKQYDSSIKVLAVIESVENALLWFEKNKTSGEELDLLFMDIHLEDGDSFQIIKSLNLQIPIIFTTAFDEYMIKAFKVNSIDYLLKPINFEDLSAAINKYKALKTTLGGYDGIATNENLKQLLSSIGNTPPSNYRERFMITVGTKIRTIKTTDIAFFYLDEGTVFLTTFDGTTLPMDYSLDKLVQSIDPKQFFRINRQFVISLDAIQVAHTFSAGKLKVDLKPKPKHEAFVSGDRITEFKEWLGK